MHHLQSSCFDFKALAENLKNFELDIDRSKVQWNKIKTLKIIAENPNIVHFQYAYNNGTLDNGTLDFWGCFGQEKLYHTAIYIQ